MNYAMTHEHGTILVTLCAYEHHTKIMYVSFKTRNKKIVCAVPAQVQCEKLLNSNVISL